MILAYLQDQGIVRKEVTFENKSLLEHALWVDLLSPTREEEDLIEDFFNIDIPTKKEMEEIEPSDRLYKEDDIVFMTTTMLAKSDSPEPIGDAVTFILSDKTLFTVRYIEPHSFPLFSARLIRHKKNNVTALEILLGLLEATIDRLADILEIISNKLDKCSHTIFHGNQNKIKPDFKQILQEIGSNGDLGTKVRDSLVSFNRMVSFLSQSIGMNQDHELRSRVILIRKDIEALSDHTNFISNKVAFLLNATLGMVNLEQNDIIKIFSVAAVIFLPPTLIASIYGMNFKIMPELLWELGYPFAILLMLISAWLPYRYFKKRNWL